MRMVRLLLPLLLMGATVRAADTPATAPVLYTVTGTAKEHDGMYLLKILIIKTDGQLKSEIASRPAIQMKNGQSVELMMGSADARGPAGGGGGGGGAATKLMPFTGYKLTAIKPTSNNQVLYVLTVVEEDVVTWASTGTFVPEAATQPAK